MLPEAQLKSMNSAGVGKFPWRWDGTWSNLLFSILFSSLVRGSRCSFSWALMVLLDDSGSMKFYEDGSRIDDLKLILSRVVNAAMLFDEDGISIRFINWSPPVNSAQILDNVKSEQDLERIISQVQFSGTTEVGTELRKKVIDPLVRAKIRGPGLEKPVLIITITDGKPEGEPRHTLFETILNISGELASLPRYGKGAISFQFAQVGNDEQARVFLSELDKDPQVGPLVDCTSSEAAFHLLNFQC